MRSYISRNTPLTIQVHLDVTSNVYVNAFPLKFNIVSMVIITNVNTNKINEFSQISHHYKIKTLLLTKK